MERAGAEPGSAPEPNRGHDEPTSDLSAITTESRPGAAVTAGAVAPPRPGDPAEGAATVYDVRIPLVQEELVAAKRRTERHAHVHKEVIEQPEAILVPVHREQILVERAWFDAASYPGDGDDLFSEFDLDLPVMGEEIVAAKRARTVEEVRLHKDRVMIGEQVSATVRKERVVVTSDLPGEGARYE